MRRIIISILLVSGLAFSSVGEARVGGGRSFGSRGARGFSYPSGGTTNSPYRQYRSPLNSQPSQAPHTSLPPSSYRNPSLLHSLGAGLAGGFLGNMLFRSIGGSGPGNYGYGGGAGTGGGMGFLEIILLGGLLFFLIRMFLNRTQTASSSNGASRLMNQARPFGWQDSQNTTNMNSTPYEDTGSEIDPINGELAMDLFFQIQGAWKNRDLVPVQNILENDAKTFLDAEISKLKASHQINHLENIAVRNTEIIESWREANRDYSTVRITANLIDYTTQEDTQQIVDGNKTTPVKFEEFWTFSKGPDSPNWKLSAIQQS